MRIKIKYASAFDRWTPTIFEAFTVTPTDYWVEVVDEHVSTAAIVQQGSEFLFVFPDDTQGTDCRVLFRADNVCDLVEKIAHEFHPQEVSE